MNDEEKPVVHSSQGGNVFQAIGIEMQRPQQMTTIKHGRIGRRGKIQDNRGRQGPDPV